MVKKLYLILIAPGIGEVEHLFMCLLTIFISCFKNFLYISVSHLKIFLPFGVIFADLLEFAVNFESVL